MAQDQKKRLKNLMKKRQKDNARKKKSLAPSQPSQQGIIRRAREFPIVDCFINHDWEGQDGLARILITRQQPDGNLVFGSFLVDMFCLGLKNTHADANVSLGEFRDRVIPLLYPDETQIECALDMAHQIIYQGIDYAAKFGFKPQRDFKLSQYILDKRGTYIEPYTLTFGKDGKPLFVSGPYDNVPVILSRLEKNPGPGNYDYLLNVAGLLNDDGETYDDDDDETDVEDET
jgi:hypothetical protein